MNSIGEARPHRSLYATKDDSADIVSSQRSQRAHVYAKRRAPDYLVPALRSVSPRLRHGSTARQVSRGPDQRYKRNPVCDLAPVDFPHKKARPSVVPFLVIFLSPIDHRESR